MNNSGAVPLKSVLDCWIDDQQMFDHIVRVNEQVVKPKIQVDADRKEVTAIQHVAVGQEGEYRDMWDGSAWMKTISRNISFWKDDYLSNICCLIMSFCCILFIY